MSIIRWYTQSGSVHELDTETAQYVRLQVGEDSQELRRDGEPVHCYTLSDPGEGGPLVIDLQLREDGVRTRRVTSPIVRREVR